MRKIVAMIAAVMVVFAAVLPAYATELTASELANTEYAGVPDAPKQNSSGTRKYEFLRFYWEDANGVLHAFGWGKGAEVYYDSANDKLVTKDVAGNNQYSHWTYSTTESAWKVLDSDWGVYDDSKVFTEFSKCRMIYSNYDVYTETGESFFPYPPAVVLGQVMEREVPGLSEVVVGAMKILALCGTGLLASLVALPTLSKVFSTFLRQ